MTERTLKRLVGALAVVLAVWAVAELMPGGSGAISAPGELARFFDGVEAESLEAVRFTRGDSTLELNRSDSAWTIRGFPADSASVERFMDAVAELRVGDLVATNPENHSRMGVVEDSAVAVDFVVDGRARTILVGDAGRRFGTAYVRLPGADEVFLLEGDLRTHARRGLDQWRNRVMVAVDTAAVARVEVERDGDAYALVRGDSVWTFTDGGEARETAVRGVLSELARLVASGFVAEGDSLASLPAAAVTRAYTDAGDLVAEVTVGEGSGERWARTASDEYLYRVSSFRANRVAPPLEDVEPGS